MRRFVLALAIVASTLSLQPVLADDIDDETGSRAETIRDGVRVTLVKAGGQAGVHFRGGGGGGAPGACTWTALPVEVSAIGDHLIVGSEPDEESQLYVLLCDGEIHSYIWVPDADVVDLDAVAASEAERYIEDVLVPAVRIGVNPAAKGLVGLASWFWIEGFTGAVTAPPISAFGMRIDVRMTAGGVEWDFGDGTVVEGDLGRAYPEESTVQHPHQAHGTYTVTATIALVPEYRVDGGPWLSLPGLATAARVDHPVEARQPVLTDL